MAFQLVGPTHKTKQHTTSGLHPTTGHLAAEVLQRSTFWEQVPVSRFSAAIRASGAGIKQENCWPRPLPQTVIFEILLRPKSRSREKLGRVGRFVPSTTLHCWPWIPGARMSVHTDNLRTGNPSQNATFSSTPAAPVPASTHHIKVSPRDWPFGCRGPS